MEKLTLVARIKHRLLIRLRVTRQRRHPSMLVSFGPVHARDEATQPTHFHTSHSRHSILSVGLAHTTVGAISTRGAISFGGIDTLLCREVEARSLGRIQPLAEAVAVELFPYILLIPEDSWSLFAFPSRRGDKGR